MLYFFFRIKNLFYNETMTIRKERLIMKKLVEFYRVMSGYEFIEFMRKFGWKHNGLYQKPSEDMEPKSQGYQKLSETRKKFEGWDYWFGRCFPVDVLDEEHAITYAISKTNKYFDDVKTILVRNGFKETGEAE